MKKIVVLSLLPAFLSADFVGSFANGFGNKLGDGLGSSKWLHYSVEAIAQLGTMSPVKSNSCEKLRSNNISGEEINTESTGRTFFNQIIEKEREQDPSQYILKGNPLLKMGAGLRVYMGLGIKNFNVGFEYGFAYLFNGSTILDAGLHFYYRYLDFFYRSSGGIQFAGLACDSKTAKKFYINGWYGRFQVGYYFHEGFYVSLAVAYSKFSNQKYENGRGLLSEYDYNVSTNNEVKGKSLSIFLSLGMTSSVYEDHLKSAEETATSKELAKLRARDQYKEEKYKKELAKKNIEEANKEYQEFLRTRKNKTRG